MGSVGSKEGHRRWRGSAGSKRKLLLSGGARRISRDITCHYLYPGTFWELTLPVRLRHPWKHADRRFISVETLANSMTPEVLILQRYLVKELTINYQLMIVW